MFWRKWLVRGLVFSALSSMGLAALLYQAWTCPAAMRASVLANLSERFHGATVAIETARLRLLGGITVSDVRFARRDGLDSRGLLYVPSGVIYPDKERLLDGAVKLRQVEMDRPEFRVVRQRDGTCNWQGVLSPPDIHEHVPTIIVHRGTLLFEDRSAAPGTPLLEIHDLNLTVVNDPVTTLNIEGSGQTDVAGPVKFSARFHRSTLEGDAKVELLSIPVGPTLVQRLSLIKPEAAAHIRQLSAQGAVLATFAFRPRSTVPVSYDLNASLKNGSFSHSGLPMSLEQVEASLHCVDGEIPLVHVTASFPGQTSSTPGRLEATVHDLAMPMSKTNDSAPPEFEEWIREADVKIEHLQVGQTLLTQLPDPCSEIEHDYHPTGPMTLCCSFHRDEPGIWEKHWVIQTEGMRSRFFKFPYELDRITGAIELKTRNDHNNDVAVHLIGYSGALPVTIDGEIHGEKSTCGVALDITADAAPLDRKLFDALPQESQKIASQFLPRHSREFDLNRAPMGLADIRAFIRRKQGRREFENRYVLTFHDSALQYDIFPLPLEKVTGVLDIQPDHWECHNFRGMHGDGEIRVECHSKPVAVTADRPPMSSSDNIFVDVQGRNVPIDPDFERALAPPKAPGRVALQNTFQTLALSGRLNFNAHVEDRPDQPQDFEATVSVRGCSMKPAFFRYAMSDVGGTVRFVRNRPEERQLDHVYLTDLSAHHGSALLGMEKGEIWLKPGRGGYYARFNAIHGTGLQGDADLLSALPLSVRKGLEAMQLQTPVRVQSDFIVDASADAGAPPVLWWDGKVWLDKARLKTGVDLVGVDGCVYCCGRHDGQQLDGVVGRLQLDQAIIFNQPVHNLCGQFEMAPQTSEILRVRNLSAELFGGNVGGEARIEFGSNLRYELVLQALGVDLQKFGLHNLGRGVELQGPVTAGVALWGEGTDISGLKGNGQVGVSSGKLYHLPIYVDLIKAFGLRLPDRTAFEQAHIDFGIDGPQLLVRKLELYGNALSLRGRGTVNLDGSDLNLDFNADWARLGQVLPTEVFALPQSISDQLFKIKLRGSVTAPRFEKEPVPGIVEPLKRAFGNGG